jgi:hypothetical protein
MENKDIRENYPEVYILTQKGMGMGSGAGFMLRNFILCIFHLGLLNLEY